MAEEGSRESDQKLHEKPPKNKYFDIHPPVFWPAAGLSLLFIVLTLALNNTVTLTADHEGDEKLGARLLPLDGKEKEQYELEKGLSIEKVGDGFLASYGIGEDRIITHANGDPVGSTQALKNVIQEQFRIPVTFLVKENGAYRDSVVKGVYKGERPIGAGLRLLTDKEKARYGVGSGMIVDSIDPEGFLASLGIGEGRVIRKVKDIKLKEEGQFERILSEHIPQPIDLTVMSRGFGVNVQAVFSTVQTYISNKFGWFFVLLTNLFIVFLVYLAISKLGKLKLGKRDEKPEFSTMAWFSMLFSAGMGIGIIFWSIAEPMKHYFSPPYGEGGTAEAAETAMNFTFLHWGLHAWGIYALVGLALAFFAFNQKLPLSIRSVFYPVVGDRIYGPIGNIIDTLAVISTLFGLATSLGLGVQQISAGLEALGVLPNNIYVQVSLIILITLAATISVVLGIDKGVKVLSELNIRVGAIFLIFVFLVGPTLFILDSFIQNTGNYLQTVIGISTWTETYSQTTWQNGWTVFYWSWWIAWSPFVGMFIARVSRGRTVREFITGVLLVPTLITFFWLSCFGGSAIYLELNALGNIAEAVDQNVAVALFEFLEEYPLFVISSVIGVFMVTIFFVTSSDSGSLVVDSLTSGGKVDAPVGQRIFWAQTEGAVAAVLLIGGGLSALQTATITTGLPFALILLLMCYSLNRGLKEEYAREAEIDKEKERDSYREVIKDLVERRRGGSEREEGDGS